MRRQTHVIAALWRGDRREVVLLRACLDFFVDSPDPFDALVVVAAMMTSSLIAMKTTFDNIAGDRRRHNNVRLLCDVPGDELENGAATRQIEDVV